MTLANTMRPYPGTGFEIGIPERPRPKGPGFMPTPVERPIRRPVQPRPIQAQPLNPRPVVPQPPRPPAERPTLPPQGGMVDFRQWLALQGRPAAPGTMTPAVMVPYQPQTVTPSTMTTDTPPYRPPATAQGTGAVPMPWPLSQYAAQLSPAFRLGQALRARRQGV